LIFQPLIHLRMSSFSSNIPTCRQTPRASMLHRPLKHLQMSSSSSLGTCPRIPRAAMLSRPLQHSKMSTCSGRTTCLLTPRASMFPCPLQNPQIPSSGSLLTRILINRQRDNCYRKNSFARLIRFKMVTAVLLCPVKDLRMSTDGCNPANPKVPWTRLGLCPSPLQHLQIPI
jgi:hypothetical protein